MKKTLASLAVGLALLFAAGTSYADVFAVANVFVDKDVFIDEDINIFKDIEIFATVDIVPEKAAESLAVINQENSFNEACENCAEKRDTIKGSVTGNTGITTANQASGNNINQGNAIAAAIDQKEPPDPAAEDGFAEAQAVLDQDNFANVVTSESIIFRDALIEDSVSNNSGITAVNQGTGNNISQANVVSLAVSLSGGVALSEALLGQNNAGNSNDEFDIFKTAKMLNSVNSNNGITQVNQSAGNMANQGNVVSAAATITR